MHTTPLHLERMARFRAAGLYLVTSGRLSAGRPTETIVSAAIEGGARLIQLREKELSTRDLTALARRVRALTAAAGALLLINDRLDVALAVGADGAHLGQDDLPIADARRLAPDLILGASTHDPDEARAAEAAGASYVNIGPIFPTNTKLWSSAFLGIAGLRRIAPQVRLPFTVMGGIKAENIPDLLKAGAQTIAVVTAVTAAPDPRAATAELLAEITRGQGSGFRNAAGPCGRIERV